MIAPAAPVYSEPSVADAYRADFLAHPPDVEEFPVTTMSADLARAISSLVAVLPRVPQDGLDVGVGNGIHAAAQQVAGVARVVGIDVSPAAIAAAERRHRRLLPQLGVVPGLPLLRVQNLVDLPNGEYFDLITTNPPSFFQPLVPSLSAGLPMALALYDGDRAAAHDPQPSFLYRFFHRVVGPHLRPGGVVLCTWPAIERRLSEGPDGTLVHPAAQLAKWFGWTFSSAHDDGHGFFSRDARVGCYGTNKDLLQQVEADIGEALYSKSLHFSDGTMTFRYGLLALQRDVHRTGHFECLIIPG
jgi:hypothetical protein